MDFLPVEFLAYFNLPFFDDVGRFASVIFSNNDFPSLDTG